MNYDAYLTPKNHGIWGDPHPQYDSIKTYQSAVDSSSNPWLEIFELQFASPDLQISNTLQRIFFGFKVFDNASDTVFSVTEFSCYIGVLGTSLKVQGTKRFAHQSYQNSNNNLLNLHVFWTMNSTSQTWTAKVFLEMPWNYKRAVILQPWVNIPKDRYVTTPTNPVFAKLSQREKTESIFSPIANAQFISADAKSSIVSGYTDYKLPWNDYNTHTSVVNLNGFTIICVRNGNQISYSLNGVNAHTFASGVLIGYIPSGYRPTTTSAIVTFSSTALIPLTVANDGSVTFIGSTSLPANTQAYGSGVAVAGDPMPVDGQ